MENFSTLQTRVACLPFNDIDTDQIIPARFLKTTDKAGLAANLFADWRYNNDGSPKMDFELNKPETQHAQALLAGHNFGCGSSREHAPWALTGFGFRAVIASSFGDIFRNNALKNGLLPVQLSETDHQTLLKLLNDDPQIKITIDLPEQKVLVKNMSFPFPIDSFSKTCLLKGTDELGYLLEFSEKIAAYEQINKK